MSYSITQSRHVPLCVHPGSSAPQQPAPKAPDSGLSSPLSSCGRGPFVWHSSVTLVLLRALQFFSVFKLAGGSLASSQIVQSLEGSLRWFN